MSVSPCYDAGSAFCPCELAALGQCVSCSLLRGEDVCACGWSGLCVYAEFVRMRNKAKPRRRRARAEVVTRTDINSGTGARAFLFDLRVPPDLALWCEAPGSFVLVRPKGAPERFNVPLSVMLSRGNTISLAVEVAGPKTVALERACLVDSHVDVVGPFWSGLQGLANLKRRGSGRVLIVAKGIAQGCAVQTARYVVDRGGYAKVLMGPGPVGSIFAGDLVEATGATLEVLPRSKDHNLSRIFAELSGGGYDVLVSEGSDSQHRSLKSLLDGLEDPPAFAWSSNLTMTCAEGICGSCLTSGFRGCKASIPADAGFGS